MRKHREIVSWEIDTEIHGEIIREINWEDSTCPDRCCNESRVVSKKIKSDPIRT